MLLSIAPQRKQSRKIHAQTGSVARRMRLHCFGLADGGCSLPLMLTIFRMRRRPICSLTHEQKQNASSTLRARLARRLATDANITLNPTLYWMSPEMRELISSTNDVGLWRDLEGSAAQTIFENKQSQSTCCRRRQ